MLIETYAILWAFTIVMFVLTLFYRHGESVPILAPWVCALLLFGVGINSFSIEKIFCEAGNVTAGEWTCYTYLEQNMGMVYLGFGFGFIMLTYAIINTLYESGRFAER